MLEVVPYKLDDIKNELKRKTIDILGITDAQFEGSNISQLINLLAYSNVINNTNLTYGLNELFIAQAVDRRNVIKLARQKGYINKRRISYQYKIKLRVKNYGIVSVEKYASFKGDENTYTYFGDQIIDIYGIYVSIKILTNEFNNGTAGLSLFETLNSNIASGNNGVYIITEEGIVCQVHALNPLSPEKITVEPLNGKDLAVFSLLPQLIYTWDETNTDSYDATTGYRNLDLFGSITNVTYDDINLLLKLQISISNSALFNPYNEEIMGINEVVALIRDSASGKLKFSIPFANPVSSLNWVKLKPAGLSNGVSDIFIDVDQFEYNLESNNFLLNMKDILVKETHTGTFSVDMNGGITINSIATIEPETFQHVEIIYSDGVVSVMSGEEVELGINKHTVIIPSISIAGMEEKPVSQSIIQLNQTNIKNIVAVSVYRCKENINVDVDKFLILSNGRVQILNNLGTPEYIYDGCIATVSYDYIKSEPITEISIYFNYTDAYIEGKEVIVSYFYEGAISFGNMRFFFSDFRGEKKENEHSVLSDPIDGFDGFISHSYDRNTSVLSFSMKDKKNYYVGTSYDGLYENAKQLHELIKNPFRRTRFSPTTKTVTVTNISFTPFNSNFCFLSAISLNKKDTLEIIVKEGKLKRHNTLDGSGLPLYPRQTIQINPEIFKAGYFIINEPKIEENGLEVFISRILENGFTEDSSWARRHQLLIENTNIQDKTYITMPDISYPEYTQIYTKYAGTGLPLEMNFLVKINVLESNGSLGYSKGIIEPDDLETTSKFEGKLYVDETHPHYVYIEGSDEETTESIRENSQRFSNTGNRAVTRNDYTTIINAQEFVSTCHVWGGEEEVPNKIPGHIFVTIEPYSRPKSFTIYNDSKNFVLANADKNELFFPTYYQVTGKDGYDSQMTDTSAPEVLFNILDKYKIITLQLNYVKTIYLDISLDINILKYKQGQTMAETNIEIFNTLHGYFLTSIEKYNAIYFRSTTVKYIDKVLGNDYGLDLKTKFSIELTDSYSDPDSGTFVNFTKKHLSMDMFGNSGMDDIWTFEMPLDVPIYEMFYEDIIVDGIVVEYGRLMVDKLVNCNTDNFLIDGDFLYMMLDDGTFVSLDVDKNMENIRANSNSSVITIAIMYTKIKGEDINGDPLSEHFKVGEYSIFKKENVIKFNIFTHKVFNMDSTISSFTINSNGELVPAATSYDVDGKLVLTGYVNNFGAFIRFDSMGNADTTGQYTYSEDGNSLVPIEQWEPSFLIDVELSSDKKAASFSQMVEDTYKTNPYYTEMQPLGVYQYLDEAIPDDVVSVRTVPLPRGAFIDKKVKLYFNSLYESLKVRRNVLIRLRDIKFQTIQSDPNK